MFFGFIRDYKGLDLLIESMKNLNDEHLLLIAGEVYGDFKKYDEQIDKLNVRNKISLHVRYIPETEIPLFFSAADVCLLPYRTATQSGIVGIAYHFDLPVIVTNVGGLAEMVEENKTGLIIHEPSLMMIPEKIREFFDMVNIRNYVSNIEAYKQTHSWKALAEKVIEFYNSLK